MQLTCIELVQNRINIVLPVKGTERLGVNRATDGHANKIVSMGEYDEVEGRRCCRLDKLSM